ncbi:hypothetical protein AcdelDRAFT_1335 [Acidovorax delafieldii 2AN]|uniref:TspB protein n=1 Tax=Acidovorax delafieldii 2AN TaxID=573060 RepID=C5T355_ACIDE|nr:hypothetical protein AcdelDRAFT_1335 [Acidovorax delafieldii 2AN]
MGGYGYYTGGTCGPSEPGKPAPVDPTKPNGDPADGTKKPAPGDPKPGEKPSGAGGGSGSGSPPNNDGTCPSGTYKSGGSCYPKDPPKVPPDGDGKCPSGFVKIGGECAATQPAPDKDPGDKDKSSFGGQCEATSCEGDAIQCAIVREQYRTNCKLFNNDTDTGSVFNKAVAGTDGFGMDELKGKATQVSVSTFDQSGFGWSHTCPADPSIPLNFGRQSEFTIPFSRVCGPLSILSLAGVGITLLGSLVWVLGGKNNRG